MKTCIVLLFITALVLGVFSGVAADFGLPKTAKTTQFAAIISGGAAFLLWLFEQ